MNSASFSWGLYELLHLAPTSFPAPVITLRDAFYIFKMIVFYCSGSFGGRNPCAFEGIIIV